MKEIPTVVYLHGLGSSPESPKAVLLAQHFATNGVDTIVPQLSLPSLQRLSVVAALRCATQVVSEAGGAGRVVVIGSSFGGFLALQALGCLGPEIVVNVAGVVLLAPVLYPWHPELPIISQTTEAVWQRDGEFPIEEGATGGVVPVHYRFLEELKRCANDEPRVTCPTLVVHGIRDERVPYSHSVEFCEQNPRARLVSLDDDHQMMTDQRALVSVVNDFVQGL
jgi:pimeloyl-ACP methyl ester carboxylesterase